MRDMTRSEDSVHSGDRNGGTQWKLQGEILSTEEGDGLLRQTVGRNVSPALSLAKQLWMDTVKSSVTATDLLYARHDRERSQRAKVVERRSVTLWKAG